MRSEKSRAVCCECSMPIYDNVDPKRKVVCGDCVQRRLFYFSKETRLLGVRLKEARVEVGFSQRVFASVMECSKSLVDMVEKGQRQPTPKMREFMLKNLLSVNRRKQTGYEEGLNCPRHLVRPPVFVGKMVLILNKLRAVFLRVTDSDDVSIK